MSSDTYSAIFPLEAASIGLVDAGSHFSTKNVEAALQQLAAGGIDAGVWTEPTTSTFDLTVTGPSAHVVPIRLQLNPVGSNNAGDNSVRALEICRPPIDGSTGAAQNGQLIIGISIGMDSSGPIGGIKADGGSVTVGNIGTTGKIIPMLLQPANPIVYNAAGANPPVPRLGMIFIPNAAIQGSGGTVTVQESSTIFIEGGPDNNDGTAVLSDNRAVTINADPLWVGDNIKWGGNKSSNSYLDAYGGGSPLAAPSGVIRQIVNGTTQGFDISIDTSAYRPLTCGISYYHNFNTIPSQVYPAGSTTIVGTVNFSDTGKKGLSNWNPNRWTFPAAVTVAGGAGGQLVPKIRFWASSGSPFVPSQNLTAGSVIVRREDVYIAMVGTWINLVEFIVVNTNASNDSTNLSIGSFEFEGMAY